MSPAALMESFNRCVVPNYARFPIVFARGKGTRIWDVEGKEYLDFGAGIAVCSLGHAHPALGEALARQAGTLVHVSNLYYHELQGQLAAHLVALNGEGKCFFCNSGAEANEALYKLARKAGHDRGRFEILTALNSFHGRTLAGIAATGQDKVKKGFEPAVAGFRHVPFNDLEAMRRAVTDQTAAILVEGIQGESGIYPATADYLRGLRALCDEKGLLLFVDAVQCGMFRTGRFQSYQRILESSPDAEVDWRPDAVSMAKGIADGVPMGAVWIRAPYAEVLGAGSHGTTFGGTPLACAAALAVFDVIAREKLDRNARALGAHLKAEILNLKSPAIREVRGLGLMIGIELQPGLPAPMVEGKTPAGLTVTRLHERGLLTIPSGERTLRLLPPLNVTRAECDEAVEKLASVLKTLL